MTDQGRLARACRLLVKVELFDRAKGRFNLDAILDTGAPFSVFPFSVWNKNNLSWNPLGSQMFTLQGQLDPDAMKWLGISCELAFTQIALVDEAGRSSRSFRVIAKFVQTPLPVRFESDILLGYHFLMDNRLTLTLNPAVRTTAGKLANVVGSLLIP